MAGFDDSQYDWRAVLAESGDLPESSPAEGETDQEFSDAIFQEDPNFQSISGMGIEETQDNTDLNDMLQDINKDNTAQAKEEAERLAAEEKARIEADEKARQEALAKIWKEQHEIEQAEKAKREAEEAAEAERIATEEEARRQANPLRKLAGMIPKPKEKTPEEIEAEKTAKAERAQKLAEEKAKKAEEKKAQAEQTKAVKKEKPEKPAKPEKQPKQTEKKGLFGGKKETSAIAPVTSNANSGTDYKYLATHDELTKLKNKRAYDEDLATVKAKNTVIMFFDINNLKMANDTLGHAAGNKLILATAEELTKLYPENSYRVGGDEFIVLLQGKGSYLEIDKKIKEDIAKFNIAMKKRTADSKAIDENLIYAVSVGYAIGDGKKTKEDIQAEADKKMYDNKQAYKKAHPKEDARNKDVEVKVEPEKDYDELLPEESRQLKTTVKENHMQVSELNTEKILREIQSRADDIYAILITDKNFDCLFIIQDVEYFLNLMTHGADYSYLYVIYQGGAQYYGADEYFSEITVLFENIAKLITSSGSVSQKDLLKVKGINIFKNIFVG